MQTDIQGTVQKCAAANQIKEKLRFVIAFKIKSTLKISNSHRTQSGKKHRKLERKKYMVNVCGAIKIVILFEKQLRKKKK